MSDEVPAFYLSIVSGGETGEAFKFQQLEVTLGRIADNDLVLYDGSVSRRHSVLYYRNHQFIVEDLGSSNGTFLNGLQVVQPMVVSDGDRIGIGSVAFVFSLQDPAEVGESTDSSPALVPEPYIEPNPSEPYQRPRFGGDASAPLPPAGETRSIPIQHFQQALQATKAAASAGDAAVRATSLGVSPGPSLPPTYGSPPPAASSAAYPPYPQPSTGGARTPGGAQSPPGGAFGAGSQVPSMGMQIPSIGSQVPPTGMPDAARQGGLSIASGVGQGQASGFHPAAGGAGASGFFAAPTAAQPSGMIPIPAAGSGRVQGAGSGMRPAAPAASGFYPVGGAESGMRPAAPAASGFYPAGGAESGMRPAAPAASGFYPMGGAGSGMRPAAPAASGFYPVGGAGSGGGAGVPESAARLAGSAGVPESAARLAGSAGVPESAARLAGSAGVPESAARLAGGVAGKAEEGKRPGSGVLQGQVGDGGEDAASKAVARALWMEEQRKIRNLSLVSLGFFLISLFLFVYPPMPQEIRQAQESGPIPVLLQQGSEGEIHKKMFGFNQYNQLQRDTLYKAVFQFFHKTSRVVLSFRLITPDEVDILVNDQRLRRIPATALNQWQPWRLEIPQRLLGIGGVNVIVFQRVSVAENQWGLTHVGLQQVPLPVPDEALARKSFEEASEWMGRKEQAPENRWKAIQAFLRCKDLLTLEKPPPTLYKESEYMISVLEGELDGLFSAKMKQAEGLAHASQKQALYRSLLLFFPDPHDPRHQQVREREAGVR